MDQLSTGMVLNNRYRIVKRIAQGGFGAIYRAWDVNLRRPCALKESLGAQEVVREQFMREASILAGLTHPNLPRVIDFFDIPGQGHYLVMDFIEGQDLNEMIEARRGPLEESQVLPWMMQICDALIFLHAQKPPIIHRDIKPANIKINESGQAILVDFGIAKIQQSGQNTALGARAVTPGYSPPEQYGQGATDVQSDVYALGTTIYTLLTGKVPPDSVDIMAGIYAPPQPIKSVNPKVSEGISNVIEHAMQLDKARRFANMQEFKAALVQPNTVSSFPATVSASVNSAPAPTVVFAEQAEQPRRDTVPPIVQPGIQPTSIQPEKTGKRSGCIWIGVIGVLLIIILGSILGGGWMLFGDQFSSFPGKTPIAEDVAKTIEAAEAETLDSTATTALENTPTIPPASTQAPATKAPEATKASPPTDAPTKPPTASLGIGSTKVSEKDGMTLLYVPAGKSPMGASSADSQALNNEKPLSEITLDAYWIDQTEVTNAMFAKCVADGGCAEPRKMVGTDRNHYYDNPDMADYPIIYINWNNASDYCEWAGRRLPTEAEWEKAARGEDNRVYPWGNEKLSCDLANYWAWDYYDTWNERAGEPKGCSQGPQKVGSYSRGASPYGALDMLGNVGEWVADWYQGDYYSIRPDINPKGPVSGQYRVVRGLMGWFTQQNQQWIRHQGHLYDFADFQFNVRIGLRSYYSESRAFYDLGFRCAATP